MTLVDLAGVLTATVAALGALPGVETCATDPAAVVAPGVLVRVADLERLTMGGWAVNLELALVVADSDGGPGPAAALGALLSTVLTYAQPDGPVVARSILLPSNPAPLPALLFPLTVRTDA